MNRIAVGITVFLDLSQQFFYFSFRTALDQQANLSQLASLAGVQNDSTYQQQQLHQPIDQPASDADIRMGMGNGNIGNSVLNDSGGSNTSF